MKNQFARFRVFKTGLAVVALGLCGLALVGCSGGTSGTSSNAIATYEGGGGGTKELPAAEVLLQTFSNNTLTGTITVAKANGSLDFSQSGLVALPAGSYKFTATVAANHFTGQGNYLGSPAFNFTVEGVLPTPTLFGLVTVKGTTAEGPFSYDLLFHKTTGPIGQDGNFSFSNLQNSNLTATNLTNTVTWSTILLTTQFRNTSATFNSAPTAPTIQTLGVFIHKSEAFVAGDVLPIRLFSAETPDGSFVQYAEGSTNVKLWHSVSGSVKIVDIKGQKATVELVNVRMEPDSIIAGHPNAGTGEFTVNGTGTATILVNPIPSTPNTL